jgi:ferredoxin
VSSAGSGLTCVWSASEDLSLLELAERAGVAIQSDCRAGSCLTCRTAVRSGSTTMDLGDGSALLCVGRPKTERLVLDC